MEKTYKAVQYVATIHHEAIIDENEPWNSVPAYDTSEKRFCIVSIETGEVLDDAQGYGYKTAQKAYSAYAYKIRDKCKDKEKESKRKHIEQRIKENKEFVKLMDWYALQIAKGSMPPYDKLNAKLVNEMLKGNGLYPDFKAGELLEVYMKMR